MGSQQFCLRWNNHQSNMLSVFDQLLQNEALVDVTLACDGLSLKAHKVVLSACSPYFQALFLDNPCQHPIVFMKDVRYSDLKALVDFMYKGEVNVSQEQLNAVLETAESLKVKGLAEVTPESAQSRGGGGGGGNGGGSVAGERGGDSRPSGGGGNGGDNHQHHHHHHLLSTYHQAAKVIRNAGSGLLMSDSYPRSSSGGTSGGDHNGGRESLSGAPHGGATSSSSPPPLPASSPRPSLAMSIMLDQMKRSHSPPAKRRKAKPRKRVAEHPMPSSDHEDSDALDLSTASPEQMDPSCIDMNDGDGGRDRDRERCSSYELSGGMSHLGGALHLSSSGEHHRKLSGGGGSGHDLSTSIATSNNSTSQHMSALHLDVEDNSATSQEKDYNSNQSQAQASPSGMASHRIPIPKIPPLVSVMSTAPLPSTSATQASIQDMPWWSERRMRAYHCEHCKQSFDNKGLLYTHGCPKERVGFTCEVCGSRFPSHSRYLRHREIHNPDRETFTCYLCNKTMVRLDHLRTHLKNLHGISP